MYSSPLTGFPKKSIAWNRILRPILVIEKAYLIADYQECDELVEMYLMLRAANFVYLQLQRSFPRRKVSP